MKKRSILRTATLSLLVVAPLSCRDLNDTIHTIREYSDQNNQVITSNTSSDVDNLTLRQELENKLTNYRDPYLFNWTPWNGNEEEYKQAMSIYNQIKKFESLGGNPSLIENEFIQRLVSYYFPMMEGIYGQFTNKALEKAWDLIKKDELYLEDRLYYELLIGFRSRYELLQNCVGGKKNEKLLQKVISTYNELNRLREQNGASIINLRELKSHSPAQ